MDLLRVIRHHRARLATPIRTVQKIYSDADLDNIPFASDSVFNRGAASSRPPLLIEPPYKVNGEDRTKARPVREEDVKGTERSTPDNKADSKARETPASSSNANDISTSDSKLEPKVGQVSNVDSKEDHKVTAKTPSDHKPVSKVTVKTSKLVSKPDQKSAEVSSSDSSDPLENSSNKQPKKGSLENVSLPNTDNSSFLSKGTREKTDSAPSTSQVKRGDGKTDGVPSTSQLKRGDEKTDGVPSTSQSKREDEKTDGVSSTSQLKRGDEKTDVPSTSQSKRGDEKTDSVSSTSQSKRGDERPLASQPSSSKPVLEENIVLGVALEGSKRTLPIEEGMEPPPNAAEAKELAMSHSSNGSVEKEKQQSQRSSIPGSGDQLGQQE